MMATNNLELQAELNELLEKGDKLLSRNTKHYQDQATVLANLVRAHQLMNNSLDPDKVESLAQALENVSTTAEKYTNSTENIKRFGKAIDEASKSSSLFKEATTYALHEVEHKLKKLNAPFKKVEEGLQGLKDGFSFVGNSAKIFGSGIITATKVLGHLALSILTFPFKILSNLINNVGGGNNELAQMLEEIRKQFGYLRKTAGGAIIEMAKSMKGELANTGLSVYRIVGRLVDRLKEVFEYAKALGPVFDTAMHKIGNVEALIAYNKGLGLTQEAQKAIATRAVASGQQVNEVNRGIANYALQLSEQFGVTMKEVSRSVGDMMADFEHFGHLGAKELTQTAVYARKLGIEVKALSAVFEKSFNLEDAATQAAQLSQAFGLNIDAMEQLKEQDPGKKLDNLRKAFFNAGRSIENMTAQERRLLSQQTGLDANSLDLAFSLKNQSLSYDQIQKKGDQAKKSQLSQAEAMQKLSGAIERLVRSGGTMSGGFFDRFFAGFNVGFKRTKEFRRLMYDLRRDLYSTFRTGVQVGREFVHVFPGVHDVLVGIDQFFKPQKFKAMLLKIREAFREFFHGLTDNPKEALPVLFKRLKTGFFEYFQTNAQGGRQLLSGAQKFFMAFATIANSMLKIALRNITNGMKYIIDLLTGVKRLPSVSDEASGAAGFFGKIFSNLSDGLGSVLKDFWTKFTQLTGIVWETKIYPWLAAHMKTGFEALFGSVAIPIGFAASKLIGLSIAKGILSSVSEHLGGKLGKVITGASKQSTTIPEIPSGAGGAVDAATDTAKAVQRSGNISWKKLGVQIGLITLFIGVAIAAFFGVVKIIRAYKITQEEVLNAVITLGGVSVLVIAAAGLAKVADSIQGTNYKALGAISIMAGAMIVAAIAVSVLVKEIEGLNLSTEAIVKTGILLTAMGPLFAMAGGIVFIAGRLPQPDKNLAIGLAAIGITVGVMALTAYGIVSAFSGFPEQQISNSVKIMGAISSLFLSASAVVGIGAIIGGVVALTGGLGAVAILGGIAFVGAVVYGMAEEAKEIIISLNSLPNSSSLSGKVKMFTDIVEVIGSIAEIVGTILSAGQASFYTSISGMLRGKNPIVEMMDSVTTFIRALGREMTNLVTVIVAQMNQLTDKESVIAKGTMFASLIGSVAEMAKALVPPTAALEESWVPGTDTTSQKLVGLSSYMNVVIPQVSGLFVLIKTQMQSLLEGNPSKAAIKGAAVFGVVFNSLAGFVKAIGDTTSKVAENNIFNNIEDLQHYMTSVIRSMRNFLQPIDGESPLYSIGQIINNIISSVGNLNANQAKALEAFSPVIGPVFSAITSILSVLSTIRGAGEATDPTAIRQNVQLAWAQFHIIDSMKGMITGLFDSIRNIFPAIVSMFTGLGNLKTNQVKNIKSVGETIGSLLTSTVSVLGIISELGSRGEGATKTFSVGLITGKLGAFGEIMTAIRGQIGPMLASIQSMPNGIGTKANALKTTFEGIKSIADAVGAVSRLELGDQTIKTKIVTNLNTISGVLSELTANQLFAAGSFDRLTANLSLSQGGVDRITQLSSKLDTLTSSFSTIGNMATRIPATTTKAIKDMVTEINNISKELATLTPINIVADLERTAHNLGMGYSREFTINTPKVNLNVTATINIDAKELETVLVERPNTRITHTNG